MSVAVAGDPLVLYGDGLRGRRGRSLLARLADGRAVRLDLERWLGPVDAADEGVIARALAPVLDIGCGPGRHLIACQRRGLPALGVDISAVAVAEARRRGAVAIEGCVFAGVPDAGAWGTALLLDGNIGIGGDAVALLRRAAALLGAGGRVLGEVGAPGAPTRVDRVRLECGRAHSAWFPWALVGVDGLAAVAVDAGLQVDEVWEAGGRWFARLDAAA